MARDWEAWLATSDLPSSVRVYAKGLYASNTNVRRDADVDIAVEWTDQFNVQTWGKTEGMTAEQLGYTPCPT
jgi:hypothetical protein